MSLVYLVLMVAVGAVLLFVIADAVLSVSRRPAWQTPQARLVSEGATLHHLPRLAHAPTPVALPVVAGSAREEAEEALAA